MSASPATLPPGAGHYREAADLLDGRGGAVTFEQTFGSALNAKLHFHALVVDGVYERSRRTGHRRSPEPGHS